MVTCGKVSGILAPPGPVDKSSLQARDWKRLLGSPALQGTVLTSSLDLKLWR